MSKYNDRSKRTLRDSVHCDSADWWPVTVKAVSNQLKHIHGRNGFGD